MENGHKGKEYNDYKNPTLWAITLISLGVGLFPILVMNIKLGGVVAATIVAISWVLLWEAYKRSNSFKQRYGY